MTYLLDALRFIPGVAKIMTTLVILMMISYFVWSRFGLKAALVVIIFFASVALIVKLYKVIVKYRERRKGAAFGKALDDAQAGPSSEEVKAAVGELGKKWKEAMENLKSSRIDIYQLPWYMLIGEPQSGKSTTLKFSDLQFPIGTESISGGGGTRNCDWWFTNQGVILDTAGRLTFQEDSATDSSEWTFFLNLLGKHRPYCPINGVILVIPVDALLNDDSGTMEKKARNISDKLLHIQRTLAIQFPVYVLLTKCDQIFGFTQFFNRLSPAQQREMMGWSNEDNKGGFDNEAYDTSFERILTRIDQLRLKYLSQPHFIEDLDKTYIFPEEIRAIKEPLKKYMNIIFEPSVYKDPLYFRGYYLTSGLQEGQPIVKACRSMLKDGAVLDSLEAVFKKSRAFFIRDFYSEKVFPEEGLVKRAFQFVKKDKNKKRMIMGLNIAFVVLGAIFILSMYRSLARRLDPPKAAIEHTVAVLQEVKGSFYKDAQDRKLIYTTLRELKESVGSTREKSYLLFLKFSQNDLTASLQNSFAYLYLDHIMVGLFEAVQEQLGEYQLAAPPNPRNSRSELVTLCAALAELKNWQARVAETGDIHEDPTIKPFLDLVVDPNWDHELAAVRRDMPLKDELNDWFIEIYKNSSPETKKFLFEEMDRRAKNLYDQLHLRVADFYQKQPELVLYQEKVKLLEELEVAYSNIQEPSATWRRATPRSGRRPRPLARRC